LDHIENPSEALKAAFRRHASGVCVITLNDPEGNPVGFTATSVTSLGSEPALATFNVARGASSWPALAEAEYVSIQMLNEASLPLAIRMSQDHTQRFVPNDWYREAKTNLPIFEKINAALICRIVEKHEVEKNAVVVVEILDGLFPEELSSLLYHQRGYVIPGDRIS
jgi:flavin reductase (DIM6/NTAB) family NADH-FMN oxidoreductase RutF